MIERLHYEIALVCPIDGVGGSQGSIVIHYAPAATTEQRAAAQAKLAAFDWSQEAHATWLANRNPEKRDLHALAASRIDDLNLIINAVSFTNAQRDAALKKLAQGQKAIIKRLVQLQ